MLGPSLGPICNSHNACKWLNFKGWVLSGEPYDRSKAICILLTTVALPKVPAEACSAIQAAVFLIEENIFDTNASFLSEAIATKLTPSYPKPSLTLPQSRLSSTPF